MTRHILWAVIAGGTWFSCSGPEAPPAQAPRSPPARATSSTGPVDPASVERVPPDVARARVRAGQALLVCAYEDARCAEVQLEGSIPFSALQARLSGLPRDQEIILYCD